jgi:glycosyltransferase involved in cell wall biosynthesis
MVLIEAMACGIPVVATDCGGPASIITDETGLLVQKGNPKEIRDAIIKVFNDYERYDPVKIKDYINSTFSYDKFLEKINEVYSVCS